MGPRHHRAEKWRSQAAARKKLRDARGAAGRQAGGRGGESRMQ